MLKLFPLRETIEKFFLITTFLVVILYAKFPFIKIPMTSVGIRIEDFLLLALFLYVLFLYKSKIKTLFTRPLERSVVIFCTIGLLSLFSAIFITETISLHLGVLHWARRIEYFIPLFFALALYRKKENNYIDLAIKLILISILGAAIYGFGQKYFSWPIIVTQNEQYSKGIALRYVPGAHLTSTFAGHYDLASYLVLVLPIVISCLFIVKGRSQKVIFFIIFLLGLWLLSNTLSRISIAAYILGAFTSLLVLKKYKEILLVLFLSFFVFSFSTDLFDRYLSIIQVTKENIKKIMIVSPPEVYAQEEVQKRVNTAVATPAPQPVFEDRSTSIRLVVEWPRALRAFLKNPLLGTGYSSITLATDNDYLRLLGEVGFLGIISFLLIPSQIGLILFKKYPFTKNFDGIKLAFVGGMVGGSVGIFVNAIFIDIFEASKFAIIFWLLVGLFVFVIRSKNEQISHN